MTLHIGYKSPFRTNPLPTNLSGNGLFLFYMVFKKRSGLQRSVFSQAFRIFRPFFKVPLTFPHYQKQPPQEQPFQLLVDIPQKMAAGKSFGYKKWATKFNLKEMSKTLLFLQEQKIGSAEELRERIAAATERYHAMGDSIKAAEARLTEISVLKTHIVQTIADNESPCYGTAPPGQTDFVPPAPG